MDAFARRQRAQTEERNRAGQGWQDHDDLVFTTEAGMPIDPANLRRTLRKLPKRAGIDGHWTVYELRHSAVSALSHAGVSLEEVADVSGHRNSRITAVVYRHNLKTTVTSARDPMETLYGRREDGNPTTDGN